MAEENQSLNDQGGALDRNIESLPTISVTVSPSVIEICDVCKRQNHPSGLLELDKANLGTRSPQNSQDLGESVAEPHFVDGIDTIHGEPTVSNRLQELEERAPEVHISIENSAIASVISKTETISLDIANARRDRPNNLQEMAERLSEPLGMALATVFYEVFERNGDFQGVNSSVNELSEILEAAFKESLFRVLGRERTAFVEGFKNAFRSSYKTMRSVRHACSKTGPRVNPYGRHSRRGSSSKSWRVSARQAHRDTVRRNFDIYTMGTLKNLKFEERGVAKAYKQKTDSSFEDDILSFITTGNGQEDGESDGPYNSSGKSCLNESLKSSFFTSSNNGQDGQNDSAGSCTKSFFSENCEGFCFTSSSHEQEGPDDTVSSMTSTNENLKSPLSQPTSDAFDLKDQHLGTDDSMDADMFSATSESSKWMVVEKDEITSAAPVRDGSSASVSLEAGKFKQLDKHPTAQAPVSQSPARVVGNGDFPMPATGTCGPMDNHTQRSDVLLPGILPVIARHSSDRYNGNDEQEYSIDSLHQTGHSQFVSVGAINASQENSVLSQEPGIDRQSCLRRGPDLMGGIVVTHGENKLIHNRQAGSSLEDTLLPGAPSFLNYRAEAEMQSLLRRYVETQETKNYLKSLEVAHNRKRLSFKEGHLRLQSESNILMRDNVNLSRSKAEFSEFKLEDRKLRLAHQELSQMCTDELVAGLCVMLFALAFSAWKFSYARLSTIVSLCELPEREPHQTGWLGTNWVYNSVNAFTWQVQSLTCELTKAGRMTVGLIFIAFITNALFRRSVASSSQSMPATIIVVVLAGICGLAGKISVDSLGGNGFVWVVFWELFCLLHAFAVSCTPWLYKYLYGPSSKFYRERPSLWLQACSILIRIFFHTALVFGLPVMAGLLPFASPEEVLRAVWNVWEPDNVAAHL